MRLEFVKAFVEITESTFVEVLGASVTTGQPSLESALRIDGWADSKVVTFIELSGDVAGSIYLHMELPTAAAIAERMLQRPVKARSLIASCIAELTSMAIGRAISWINDQSCFINMGPPIVTMEVQLKRESDVETLVFPVETACGNATLNISFVDLDLSGAPKNAH